MNMRESSSSSSHCRSLSSNGDGRRRRRTGEVENGEHHNGFEGVGCKGFGEKCNNLVKKQRTKFYILRRCIAMLLCWKDRGES